jgi:hypothetical protein
VRPFHCPGVCLGLHEGVFPRLHRQGEGAGCLVSREGRREGCGEE